MKIDIEKKTDVNIIKITGPIKAGLEFDLEDVLNENSDKIIILDFKDVPFINSAALGIILNKHKDFESTDKEITLLNISKDVKELLKITRMDRVINVIQNGDDNE